MNRFQYHIFIVLTITLFPSCSSVFGSLFYSTGKAIHSIETKWEISDVLDTHDCSFLLDGSEDSRHSSSLPSNMAKTGVVTGGIIDTGILIYIAYRGIQIHNYLLVLVSIVFIPWPWYAADLEYNRYGNENVENYHIPMSGKILIKNNTCDSKGVLINFGRIKYTSVPLPEGIKHYSKEADIECEKLFLMSAQKFYQNDNPITKLKDASDFCVYHHLSNYTDNNKRIGSCMCTVFWKDIY